MEATSNVGSVWLKAQVTRTRILITGTALIILNIVSRELADLHFSERAFTSSRVEERYVLFGKPALQIQLIDLPLQLVSRSLVQPPQEVKQCGTKQNERQSVDQSC